MAIETWHQKAQAWLGIQNKTNIPLVNIEIGRSGITQPDFERPTFSPGVIKGLSVIENVRNQQIIVTPGQAIDGFGRMITLTQDTPIKLDPRFYNIDDYPGNTGFLVIFYQSDRQKRSIEFVPETAIDSSESYYVPRTQLTKIHSLEGYCIPLARLSIDSRFQLLTVDR